LSTIFIESCKLPTPWGEFEMHGYLDETTGKQHIALTMGELKTSGNVLARVHSQCLTGDALFSLRCDCGSQLEYGLSEIAREGCGVLVYLQQEGRGIGLLNKIKAYQLQDKGADTVEANEELGFDADLRDYSVCKDIFLHLGVTDLRIMTNNPRKVYALKELGLNITERLDIVKGKNQHNEKYLFTKMNKLGHLSLDD
jgi:GTP cyclohydrolase II